MGLLLRGWRGREEERAGRGRGKEKEKGKHSLALILQYDHWAPRIDTTHLP